MIGIYKITNPSGKVYIGQSRNIKSRLNRYKNLHCEGQLKIYRSIKKYGWENHNFEILEECQFEMLNIRERYYQDLYNSFIKGLNCNLTETDILPRVISEETRLKMKESQKNVIKTKERNKKISDSLTGKPLSEEHKLSISKSHKGKKQSKEQIYNRMKNKITPILYPLTGEIFIYTQDCADYFKCSKATIKRWLNGISPNKYNLIYIEHGK